MTEENKSKIKELLVSNEIKLAAVLIEGFDENTEECWMELLDMDPVVKTERHRIYLFSGVIEMWYIPTTHVEHGFGVWRKNLPHEDETSRTRRFNYKDYPTETECKLAAIKLFIKYIDEI